MAPCQDINGRVFPVHAGMNRRVKRGESGCKVFPVHAGMNRCGHTRRPDN